MGTLEARSRARSAPGSTEIALGGSITPADIPVLSTRLELLLAGSQRRIIDCDVSELAAPDVVAVETLARMCLVCRRAGRRLRLRHASRELQELLILAGLSEILPCLPE